MQTSTPNPVENGPTLRSSRRLDWRFLLPDPSLDDVGFIGNADGELAASLRHAVGRNFSSAEHLPELKFGPTGSGFRVLVIESGAGADFAAARRLLQPGGWLYTEVRRGSLLSASPQTYARRARRAGFVEVSVQWHWPTFGGCTRIVALDDPTPFALLLSRGHDDAAARIKIMAASALITSGLAGRAARAFSIIGRAPLAS